MEQQPKKGRKTLLSFFKPRVDTSESDIPSQSNADDSIAEEQPPPKIQRVEFDDSSLVREPGLRPPIWEHPVNQHDAIRRAYIKAGPYQPNLPEFPRSVSGQQYRRFQSAWFRQFPWLEYSPKKDAAFCFPCFIFEKQTRMRSTLTSEGFRNWKRATLQSCALRAHDESVTSKNRGNFIELIKFVGKFNDGVANVVLEKAPPTAKYTSPTTQKEILHILANRVRNKIREEVGDAKFCILVDEAKDASNKEQMAIVLRFVDVQGFLRERFFHIGHVVDTTAVTLKDKISAALTRYNLDIHNMRGQGYDGASNMRGAWNGLQALFLRECPYAYYIHCFAHRLQLALVAAAETESSIWLFFSKLTSIVNLVGASPKRHTELQSAQAINIAHMIETGERETGRGANQMGNLHRPGTTRWSSHFDSICSLIDMFGATIDVFQMMYEGPHSSNTIRGQASGALIAMKSFEFIFILHLMHKIMAITDILCRALQHKSVDILNAMKGKRELIQLGAPIFGQIKGEANPKDGNNHIEPIPTLLQAVIDHLVKWHLISEIRKPNSCIINFFDEGEFSQPFMKPPHLEQPIYTLLLSESMMAFGRTLVNNSDGNYKGPLMLSLKEGSLLVLRGNSSDMARHVMCPSPNNRVSITFFKVRSETNQITPSTTPPLSRAMTLWQPGLPATYAIPNGALYGYEAMNLMPKWGMLRAPLVMLAPMNPIVLSPRRVPHTGTGVFLPWTVGSRKSPKRLPPRAQKAKLLLTLPPSVEAHTADLSSDVSIGNDAKMV